MRPEAYGRLLSVRTLASYLSIPRRQAWGLIASGRIPHIEFASDDPTRNPMIRVKREDADKWVESHEDLVGHDGGGA